MKWSQSHDVIRDYTNAICTHCGDCMIFRFNCMYFAYSITFHSIHSRLCVVQTIFFIASPHRKKKSILWMHKPWIFIFMWLIYCRQKYGTQLNWMMHHGVTHDAYDASALIGHTTISGAVHYDGFLINQLFYVYLFYFLYFGWKSVVRVGRSFVHSKFSWSARHLDALMRKYHVIPGECTKMRESSA